jgi:predicted transcriptional regulator
MAFVLPTGIPDLPVRQLVTGPAMTVEMDQAASEVRTAMNRRGHRFAAVCQGGRVTAILDRRTLNRRLATADRNLRVRDVVHPGMPCLRSEAPLRAAARLMHLTGSAAVAVLDQHHHLLGLITADALTQAVQPKAASAPT